MCYFGSAVLFAGRGRAERLWTRVSCGYPIFVERGAERVWRRVGIILVVARHGISRSAGHVVLSRARNAID